MREPDPKPAPGDCISAGTLRTSDLIEAFSEALRAYNPIGYEQAASCSAFGWPVPAHAQEDPDACWWEDEAPWVIEQLTDDLNELAPDGCYFGAHPDDGAAFGFWPSEDS